MQLLDAGALKPVEIAADRRQHERYRLSSHIELFWCESDDASRSATASGVDVSMYGMLVETVAFLTPGTKVAVSVDGVEISSKATVCHCRTVQGFFRVGLRFDTTLLAEHLASLDAVLIRSRRVAGDDLDQVHVPIDSISQKRPLTREKNWRVSWCWLGKKLTAS